MREKIHQITLRQLPSSGAILNVFLPMEAGLGDVATDIGSPPPEAVPTLITLIGNDSPDANKP